MTVSCPSSPVSSRCSSHSSSSFQVCSNTPVSRRICPGRGRPGQLEPAPWEPLRLMAPRGAPVVLVSPTRSSHATTATVGTLILLLSFHPGNEWGHRPSATQESRFLPDFHRVPGTPAQRTPQPVCGPLGW